LNEEHQDDDGGRASAKDQQARSRAKLKSFACRSEERCRIIEDKITIYIVLIRDLLIKENTEMTMG
jgi:hypothetical protein